MVRSEVPSLAIVHVQYIEVLLEVGLHVVDQQRPVVRRPAGGQVISTRSALEKGGVWFGQVLYMDIKPARFIAVGTEGNALAVMAPAAELVDCIRTARQIM